MKFLKRKNIHPQTLFLRMLTSSQKYISAIQTLNKMQNVTKKEKNEEKLLNFKKCLMEIGIESNDLNRLNVIHIAGTKGKGSTCAFIESILREHGFKTGLYSSPHLVKVNERIRINGMPIEEKDFAKLFWKCYDQLVKKDLRLGYFQFLTLMAFKMFLDSKIDVGIIEVGIGGRFDPTNVIPRPVVCGITLLEFDHIHILGSTIEEICLAKSGIMKSNVPCVISKQKYDVSMLLHKVALENNAIVYQSLDESYLATIKLGLTGIHQYENAATAITLTLLWLSKYRETKGFSRDQDLNPRNWIIDYKEHSIKPNYGISDTIVRGLEKCIWPGRGEICYINKKHKFILDGAHTLNSLSSFCNWMKSIWENNAINILVFNCSHDRNSFSLLQPLINHHNEHHFTYTLFCPNYLLDDIESLNNTIDHKNFALKLDEANSAWNSMLNQSSNHKTLIFSSINETFLWLLSLNSDSSINIYVTGSLHLVGGFLSLIYKTK